MNHQRLSSVALLCVAVGVPLSCTAATIRVPDQEPTIQAGLDTAANGDTVLVASGTYSGSGNKDLDFLGKALVLRSEGGSAQTVIDCQEEGRGIYFGTDVTSEQVVEGFTIANGHTFDGGGVLIFYGAHPIFRDVLFQGNTASSDGGGVLAKWAGATFEDCVFTGNYSAHGGGFRCYKSSAALVRCEFSDNNAGYEGGAIQFGGQSDTPQELVIREVHFDSNSSPRGGALLAAPQAATILIESCLFSNNSASIGGGAMRFVRNPTPPLVVGVTFDGNEAPQGGAVECSGSSPQIVECTFYGNLASEGGGVFCGISEATAAWPVLESSIISNSGSGAAVVCDDASGATLTCCDLYGNVGGDWVGCVSSQADINGNLCADPLFCMEESLVSPFTLRVDSPCAPGASPDCRLIGAWGVDCGASSVVEASWGAIKAFFK